MRNVLQALTAATLLCTSILGCAADEPMLLPSDSIDGLDAVEDGEAVEDGKADDFLSATAREFIVTGTSTVVIEDTYNMRPEPERLARAAQLVTLKQTALSWFLNLYLVDKDEEHGGASWGGFGAMAKNGDIASTNLHRVSGSSPGGGPGGNTYAYTFEQVLAGRVDLMTRLPTQTGPVLADGTRTRTFVLQMGRPTNTQLAQLEPNAEWYRSAPFGDWNPTMVPAAQREDVTLTMRPERASQDAWLDYNRMMEDGVLDIDVHLGWDYHDAYHVRHAREMFTWLRRQGYTTSVATFEELTRTSPPFTRTITANGRPVRIEVRLFYGRTGSDTDPDTAAGGRQLELDVRSSLNTRDVIAYSGHSGPFYGFALANWRMTSEGDLDDSDMETVQMPANRYQVVMAEGCDTYQIGSAFGRNPNKPNLRNLDVFTTTSFSDASSPATIQDFISFLTERDTRSRHRPRSVRTLLQNLDANSSGFHTMYGMHGIDDNTRLHPYADTEMMGEACATNANCGDVGNLCIRNSSRTPRYCTAACTDTTGCPSGFVCSQIASTSTATIYGNACVRR